VLESLQMSVEYLDIEPEPTWLELPLDSPPRRDERDRRQGDVEQELDRDDEPPRDVIVIELV
jgi:hypothetical protein